MWSEFHLWIPPDSWIRIRQCGALQSLHHGSHLRGPPLAPCDAQEHAVDRPPPQDHNDRKASRHHKRHHKVSTHSWFTGVSLYTLSLFTVPACPWQEKNKIQSKSSSFIIVHTSSCNILFIKIQKFLPECFFLSSPASQDRPARS